MDIAGIQPHVWFSIFVVLASAGIAALTVVLKRKDDRLREALFEIRMQREDQQRRESYDRVQHEPARRTPPQAATKPAVDAAAVKPAVTTPAIAVEPDAVTPQTAPEPVAQALEAAPLRDSKARERNLAIRQATTGDVEFVAKSGRRRKRGTPPASLPKFDTINPKEALSDWLNRRSAARPTVKAGFDETIEITAELQQVEIEAAEIVPVVELIEEAPAPAMAEILIPEPVCAPEQPVIVETAKPAVFIDESLWKSILGQDEVKTEAPKAAAVVETKPATAIRFEVIAGAGTGLPTGLQEDGVLTRLMETNKPFSGLALAVAVAQNDGRSIAREVMPHIRQMIRSLILDNEFACQSNGDEFIILCPTEQLEEAKRRLNAINEGLWDFQLREIGSFSTQFSTGDAQVIDSHVREAVSSARARLQQTRRVRKMVSLDFSSSRKPASKAV